MATYTVQAPDGHQITLQGPDGASHDEIVAQAQKLYQPKPAAPAAQPNSGAITGLRDLGPAVNSFLAGDLQFTHNIPFIGDAVMTGARYARDALAGEHPTWDTARQEVQTILNSGSAQHPIASGAGAVAGAVDTAVLGGAALKAAGGGASALNALPKATTAAGTLANAGRLAAAGATAGAVQGGAQGASNALTAGQNVVTGAEKGAAEGAVGGAVVGPAAAGVATGVKTVARPLAAKTASALSKMFGENAADVQAAWSQFKANTGRAPTMAELATLKQRGLIANASKGSEPITSALTQAADDAAQARSANMQQAFAPTPEPAAAAPLAEPTQAGASSEQIANAKTAQGDLDYTAARQHPFQIPTEDSAALGGVSPADHLAGQIVPLAGLKTADKVRIMEGLKTGRLEGQDAQLLRSKLAAAQGTGSNYSPAIASAREDLDEFLSAPGNETAAEALAKANTNFTANAQRQAGAAHGETVLGAQTADNFAAEAASKPNATPEFQTGMGTGAQSKLADTAATPQGAENLAARLATDDSLHAKLSTVFGPDAADVLRDLGKSESAAAENMNALSRKVSPAEDSNKSAVDLGTRAIVAMSSHGPYMAYHGSKILASLRMSPAVQKTVAQYLSDPKMVQQGINLLRKAGADNAQLRQLAMEAATRAGAVTGQASTDIAGQ